eukprot:TRINITY_DN1766_c0_g1_i1.p1 TRINITY_DN1766_c0_g1~~TRINITY_DN1766_c0_g1_i1.p1  ORF type:complete len:328 (+),score=140.27 TRINITY_DN1766_c0_g1_i1:25-984(+)
MANSRFEYVRKFEVEDTLTRGCYVVVRIDGRGFTKFTADHDFEKPNDRRGLELMNEAGKRIMKDYSEVLIAYGDSDEFSFVLDRDSLLYSRRASKIISTFVSAFTASYMFNWARFFGDKPMLYPPCFDCRCICYPRKKLIKDYLSWRQVDCHINNLYNTSFWTLVHKGNLSPKEAESRLKGTQSDAKNEMLFTEFGINYNDEDPMFKRGSILMYEMVKEDVTNPKTGKVSVKTSRNLIVSHEDLVSPKFWAKHQILSSSSSSSSPSKSKPTPKPTPSPQDPSSSSSKDSTNEPTSDSSSSSSSSSTDPQTEPTDPSSSS